SEAPAAQRCAARLPPCLIHAPAERIPESCGSRSLGLSGTASFASWVGEGDNADCNGLKEASQAARSFWPLAQRAREFAIPGDNAGEDDTIRRPIRESSTTHAQIANGACGVAKTARFLIISGLLDYRGAPPPGGSVLPLCAGEGRSETMFEGI